MAPTEQTTANPLPTHLASLSALRYDVDLTLWPAELKTLFVPLHCDQGTQDYLAQVGEARHGRVRTWLHRAMRKVWSDFDVNGFLGMYAMHLASTAQWRQLLGDARIVRCLDVGAGSGDITATFAPLCGHLEATETSVRMVRRLRQRGIPCQEVDLARSAEPLHGFDLITCLNVLDRCARPLTLLQKLANALTPGGRLVVAMALPYNPFYYEGPRTPEPEQRLASTAPVFEQAALELVQGTLTPLGLTVDAIARAPYLSCGDAVSPLYVLDDVIVVLRKL